MIRIYLSRLLGERRMTQADLSRLTGIRPNTISDIYNEIAERISIDHLNKICEALQCSLDELITYVPSDIRRTGANLIIEEHGNQKNGSKD